jgi:type II secretory pathway pseudopilin PulG
MVTVFNGRSHRRKKGFLLLEVLISTVILAFSTVGLYLLFLTAEQRAMFSILQARAINELRNQTEQVIVTPYNDPKLTYKKGSNPTTNFQQQITLFNSGALKDNPNAEYKMDIFWDVFEFPNDNPKFDDEPFFKIVNVRGVWTFKGKERVNIIQTVVLP